jgi:hypothetical protein
MARAWGIVIWPIGELELCGSIMHDDQAYWTRDEALRAAERAAAEMRLAPFDWHEVDDKLTIARTHVAGDDVAYAVLVRSIRLPEGLDQVLGLRPDKPA